MTKFTNTLPASCTIRGDWQERKIYIDDEAIPYSKEASGKGYTEILALSILSHYLPTRIAITLYKGFAAYVAKFPAEDFQWKKINLRKEVLKSQKNERTYAY